MPQRTWISVALILSACTVGSPPSDDNTEASCQQPFGEARTQAEVDALPRCCQELEGAAHCVDGDTLPAETRALLAPCNGGGLCAPDEDLLTGGIYTRKACTSIVGEGACLSACLAEVAMNAAVLTQDVCDVGERCAPCIDPRTQMPTGLCEPAAAACGDDPGGDACDDPATCVYEAGCPPVLDVAPLPSCAPDAHCFDRNLIPAGEQSRFAACPGGATLCIPDIFLTTGGQFQLASCRSLYDGEGRCLSTAMPDVGAQADQLPQDTCPATERCVPCYSPIDGSDTGICRLACDAGPVEQPTLAPSCCHDLGTCVPSAQVPADQQSELTQDACETAQLCVPDAFIAMSPLVQCDAALFGFPVGDGRCVPDCLAQTGGLEGVMTGNCSAAGPHHLCLPCNDPLTGADTGLCSM